MKRFCTLINEKTACHIPFGADHKVQTGLGGLFFLVKLNVLRTKRLLLR
jgi:hypothetical protein